MRPRDKGRREQEGDDEHECELWRAGRLPAFIPVFPLPDALLLPRGDLPLNIFEPRYVAMVDDAMRGSRSSA